MTDSSSSYEAYLCGDSRTYTLSVGNHRWTPDGHDFCDTHKSVMVAFETQEKYDNVAYIAGKEKNFL